MVQNNDEYGVFVSEDQNTRYSTKLSNDPAFSSKISPDGSMVAISFGDYSIQVLSIDHKTKLHKFKV